MPEKKNKAINRAGHSLHGWVGSASVIHDITRVKPYSIRELCYLYEICDKTLKKWMEPFADELGDRIGRYYSVNQVEIIFSKLGVPYRIGETQ